MARIVRTTKDSPPNKSYSRIIKNTIQNRLKWLIILSLFNLILTSILIIDKFKIITIILKLLERTF